MTNCSYQKNQALQAKKLHSSTLLERLKKSTKFGVCKMKTSSRIRQKEMLKQNRKRKSERRGRRRTISSKLKLVRLLPSLSQVQRLVRHPELSKMNYLKVNSMQTVTKAKMKALQTTRLAAIILCTLVR